MQTHYLSHALLKFFKTLQNAAPDFDAYVLMHLPANAPVPDMLSTVPHHFVTTPEIKNPAYGRKSGGEGWHIWQGGNTDLIALHFLCSHTAYDNYWFIEYDVRFSGAWHEFFASFEETEADFLSTTVFRRSSNPSWMHWPTLRVPPPIGLTSTDLIASFMPIYRISRRAAQAIDHAYQSGWSGHCEVTWPTIINRAGFSIEDFGGDGEFVREPNRNRFYTNTLLDPNLAPGSLVLRPARAFTGLKKEKLWHPVKPIRYKLREDARHVWVTLKPYISRLHSGRAAPPAGVLGEPLNAAKREAR